MTVSGLHHSDFYAWTRDQAERLRRLALERGSGDLDWRNLAEEIETEGEGQIRALIVQGGNPAVCLPDQDKVFAALEAKKVKGAQAFGFPSTATVADSVKGDPVKWTYTITGVDEKGIRTRVEGEGADKNFWHTERSGDTVVDDALGWLAGQPESLSARYTPARTAWIESLKAGKNPIDQQVLDMLRQD